MKVYGVDIFRTIRCMKVYGVDIFRTRRSSETVGFSESILSLGSDINEPSNEIRNAV